MILQPAVRVARLSASRFRLAATGKRTARGGASGRSRVGESGGGAAGAPQDPSQPPSERLGSAAEGLQSSLQEGAESVTNAAERAAAEVQQQAGDVVDAAVDAAEEAADTAVDALASGLNTAADAAASVADDVAAAADDAAPVAPAPAAEPTDLPELPPPEEPIALLAAPGADNGSGESSSAAPGAASPDVAPLKERLVAAVAGLDRGVAASNDDALRVENLVLQLEAAGGAVVLGAERLDGRWRLIYSSAFSSGSLGGARAGPPLGLAPLILGPIFQDIRVAAGELDNVVTLSPTLSLASLPGIDAKPPTLTLRLKHAFSVSAGNTVHLTYDKTVAKASGGIGAWLDSLPELATPALPEALRPRARGARGAAFDVTFLDEGLRVTRGDRGEVRIFLKEPSLY